MKLNRIVMLAVPLVVGALAVTAGLAARPGFSEVLYDGETVRIVVPPTAVPNEGIDSLYSIPDQLAVVGVAPGDPDYHGGKWAFHSVVWNVDPYLLTSENEVLTAAAAGDVTITRVPEKDFKGPIEP